MCEVVEHVAAFSGSQFSASQVDASYKATVTSFTPTRSNRIGSDVKVWLKAELTLLESMFAVRFEDLANLPCRRLPSHE